MRTVKDRGAKIVAAATVNRRLGVLQRIFTRARKTWKVALPSEPEWRAHYLPEPQERVRWIKPAEEAALEAAVRPDYWPLVRFARASGLRMAECLLRQDQVDLAGGFVRGVGKGKKPFERPITVEMRAILMAEMANGTDFVFTYASRRARYAGTSTGEIRDAPEKEPVAGGERRPITASGLKTMWRRARGKGLPADLRFHDCRHDFATRFYEASRDLLLTKAAMNHSKIETTLKYTHAN
jgi:integrase